MEESMNNFGLKEFAAIINAQEFSPNLTKKLISVKGNSKRKITEQEYIEIINHKDWENGYIMFKKSQVVVHRRDDNTIIIYSI